MCCRTLHIHNYIPYYFFGISNAIKNENLKSTFSRSFKIHKLVRPIIQMENKLFKLTKLQRKIFFVITPGCFYDKVLTLWSHCYPSISNSRNRDSYKTWGRCWLALEASHYPLSPGISGALSPVCVTSSWTKSWNIQHSKEACYASSTSTYNQGNIQLLVPFQGVTKAMLIIELDKSEPTTHSQLVSKNDYNA